MLVRNELENDGTVGYDETVSFSFHKGALIILGCDYASMRRGWGSIFIPWGFLHLLVWGVVILLIVYFAIRFFKPQEHGLRGSSQDRIDSLAILKARFARGEISQDEFIKMKQMLSES